MPEGIYDSIGVDDRERFLFICGHAFHFQPIAEKMREQDWQSCRGWYVDGELVAILDRLVLPIRTGVGDQQAKALFIGGVASPPEQRRRGYIDKMLKETCLEAHAEGVNLCLLHPFKHSFYAKYGWAAAMEQRIYSGEIAALSHFRMGEGRFLPISRERIPELDAIAHEALAGRWGVVMRGPEQWQGLMADAKLKRHGVIWQDSAGKARGYLSYSMEDRPHAGRNLVCHELQASDPEALRQLLAFLANHDSQVSQIQLMVPSDLPLNLLMRNPLQSEVKQWQMLRLLDVAGALSEYGAPAELSGSCVIRVHDDWLEHNHGSYRLEASDGKLSCQPSDQAADLELNIGLLAQWISRYVNPHQAAALGLCSVHNRAALSFLEALFSGPAPFNNDFFKRFRARA
jgi:predicted acetyltransferase